MADFSNAYYSSTLSVLYNSYCMNVYGSQLWCFNDYISVAWQYISFPDPVLLFLYRMVKNN